jgi:hypothetical protein
LAVANLSPQVSGTLELTHIPSVSICTLASRLASFSIKMTFSMITTYRVADGVDWASNATGSAEKAWIAFTLGRGFIWGRVLDQLTLPVPSTHTCLLIVSWTVELTRFATVFILAIANWLIVLNSTFTSATTRCASHFVHSTGKFALAPHMPLLALAECLSVGRVILDAFSVFSATAGTPDVTVLTNKVVNACTLGTAIFATILEFVFTGTVEVRRHLCKGTLRCESVAVATRRTLIIVT